MHIASILDNTQV